MKVVALLLFASITSVTATTATTSVSMDYDENQLNPLSISSRLLFWERCEERWDAKRNRMRQCCRGNYRCSQPVCANSAVCRFQLFRELMWCFHDSCERHNGDVSTDNDRVDNRRDNDGEGDGGGDSDNDGSVNVSASASPARNAQSSKAPAENTTPSPPSSVLPSSSSSPLPSPSTLPSPRERADANAPADMQCNGRRVRRDIRDLTPNELRTWQDAVLELVENGEWDELTRVHATHVDIGHNGAYFLPWHRLFLLRLENAIRRRHGSRFSLPYWDWRADAADAALSAVWHADILGGARRPNMPIPDGPFRDLHAAHPSRHTVTRNFDARVTGDVPRLWDDDALARVAAAPWPAFADAVEAAHALVHVYVGGDMGSTLSAPNDPLFYLHHGLVDLLLQYRLERHGSQDFSGTHDLATGVEQVSASRVLPPFGVDVSYAHSLKCIDYVPYSGKGFAPHAARGRRRPASICEALKRANGMSVERCRHGENVLSGTRNR